MPGVVISVQTRGQGGPDGLPRISQLSAVAATAGTVITITGVNFYYITSVAFNTVSAAFTVVSSTSIEATVPENCGTGPLDVISTYGRARWDSFSQIDGGGGDDTLIITDTKTTNYTAAVGECVLCDPTAGAFTVTLPTAAGISGRSIVVKNVSASINNVVVGATASETIDDVDNFVVELAYESVTFVSDGDNWMVT